MSSSLDNHGAGVPGCQCGEVLDASDGIGPCDEAGAQPGQAEPFIGLVLELGSHGVIEVEAIDEEAGFGHKKENPVPQGNWGQHDGDRQRLG